MTDNDDRMPNISFGVEVAVLLIAGLIDSLEVGNRVQGGACYC